MNRNWVCIDNKGYEEHLIVGKVYTEITDGFVDHQCILIKDEAGMLSEYHYPSRFVTIDEWRELQLKKIGI
jgi:hypothetical protein